MNQDARNTIEDAIRQRRKLQVAYVRSDGTHSLHVVAPVDLQLGDTQATEDQEYLWAYCYAQKRAERHRCDRIVAVRILDESFAESELIALWPTEWIIPAIWRVARDWQGSA